MNRRILSLLLLSGLAAAPTSLLADVTFYASCDYQGPGIKLAAGDYTARELQQFGIPQDAISSIDVPRGLAVTLYEDDLFRGRYGTLRRSDPCLKNDRFDDIVSSLSIRETFDGGPGNPLTPAGSNAQTPSTTGSSTAVQTLQPGQGVQLFSECSYGGANAVLAHGDYNLAELRALGIENNTLSSIKVPSGFSVTLYENDFLRGRAGRLNRDDNCLKNDRFDNMVTSISVRQAGVTNSTANVTRPAPVPADVSSQVIVAARPTPETPVVLHTDCEYGGAAVELKPGEYSATKLKAAGLENNSISSIQVLAGYQIELFENDFYRGRSGTLRQNDACLVDDRFNDFISSVIITRDPRAVIPSADKPMVATFFAHCDYKGGSASLPAGRYTRSQLAERRIGDNVIAALKVEDGYRVMLFDDPELKGPGVLFVGNDACLVDNGMDKLVSSLVIEPIPPKADESLSELALPELTQPSSVEAVDEALSCVKQYVDRNLCDSHRWRDMNKRCNLQDVPLLTDGYLRGHIDAGNCKTQYWGELARRTANPRLR